MDYSAKNSLQKEDIEKQLLFSNRRGTKEKANLSSCRKPPIQSEIQIKNLCYKKKSY